MSKEKEIEEFEKLTKEELLKELDEFELGDDDLDMVAGGGTREDVEVCVENAKRQFLKGLISDEDLRVRIDGCKQLI